MSYLPNDEITELTANIDDMTGEEIGYAFERILEAGAVDVYVVPAVMKKNRPGNILNVLCRKEDKDKVISAVFLHTRTIGIRENVMHRYILDREIEVLETPLGSVRFKKVSGYGVNREKPEHDDLKVIAQKGGMSITQAGDYAIALRNKA